MWISKRKFQDFEKRIANLEKAVQSQQKENVSYHWSGNLASPETILRKQEKQAQNRSYTNRTVVMKKLK